MDLPRHALLLLGFTLGCAEADRSRAVLNLYMHADGQTKCVELQGNTLVANPTCCPEGFSVAGFASPAATAYHHPDEGAKKYQYRHVVCLEDLPDASSSTP
jgi:hypothetical protein